MKNILIPIANGIEEIETSSIFSVLVRAGNTVRLSSIHQRLENDITLSRGMRIKADTLLANEDHKQYDMLIMPGGVNGAKNYNQSNRLIAILKERKEKQMLYAAICASPGLFLAPNKLLGQRATGYPTFKNNILRAGCQYENQSVIVDSNIITGRGAGDAIVFALKLVEILNGISKANEVQSGLLL